MRSIHQDGLKIYISALLHPIIKLKIYNANFQNKNYELTKNFSFL